METTIKATALLKTALKENQAELNFSLENCTIFYIPKMPRMHRTLWFDEQMIIFLSEKEVESDFLRCVSDPHRGILILPFSENVAEALEREVEYNLQFNVGTIRSLPPGNALMPKYEQIDALFLIRALDLLAFS